MEENRTFMIVMTPDGLFQKAALIENATIGSEVYYKPVELPISHSFLSRVKGFMTMPKSIFLTICLLLVLVSPFFFIPGDSKTYAYVSVDINPSLSIEIDKKMRVNTITAMNEDASLVIDKLKKVKGKPLEYVLSQIINESEAEGLTKNGKNMLVGVSYAKSKHSHPVKVKEMSLSSDWEVVEMTIPKEIRKVADEKHVSMNKLMIDSVEGNPENLDHVDSKERELIHLFYNNKFHHADQHSDFKHIKNKPNQPMFLNHSIMNHHSQTDTQSGRPMEKIKDTQP